MDIPIRQHRLMGVTWTPEQAKEFHRLPVDWSVKDMAADIVNLNILLSASESYALSLEKRVKELEAALRLTDTLLRRFTKRDAWLRLWPNSCKTCGGAGGWSSYGHTSPEDDAGPCGTCVEDENCPRCGKDWPNACDGPDHETCPHCGWRALNPDCCPDVEIDPMEGEQLAAARAALEAPHEP